MLRSCSRAARPPTTPRRSASLHTAVHAHAAPVMRASQGYMAHLCAVQTAPLVVASLPPLAVLPTPAPAEPTQWIAGPEMEECAVPKKKRSVRRNRIRRNSKMPDPVTHIGRCSSCGKLKLRHVVCGNCGGMAMSKSV